MLIRDILPPQSHKKTADKTVSIVIQEKTNPKQLKRFREISFVLLFACAILGIFTFFQLKNKGLRLSRGIAEAASAGFEKIVNGAVALKDSRFENAKNLFQQASGAFQNIQNQTAWLFAPKTPALTLEDPLLNAGRSLIAAGNYLSAAGAIFSDAASRLQFLPKNIFEANNRSIAYSQPLPSLTEKLKKELPALLLAKENLQKANSEIQKIPDSFVPLKLREKFRFAKDSLALITDIIGSLKADIPAILKLLGDDEPHTYLVLLQNNAELRPSGGFIGNYMIVETNDGYITKTQVFDIYSADHQLAEAIPSPPEIQPANPRWFMRDSNYSGHFPLSAAKAAWFLEKEKGPGVDSVIAIDQTFIEELLKITGPIKIPELALPLSSENFSTVISYVVESKLSGREDPKAILKSFMPAFEKALFQYTDPAALVPLLKNAAQSKHLFAYSKDADLEDFWRRHGIAGEMKPLEPKEDFLNIVHTSIGGNKSDAFIAETIIHDTYLKSDGGVVDELTLTRTHIWTDETTKRLKTLIAGFGFTELPQKILAILGRAENMHAMRIYVPAGAVLEDSSDPLLEQKFDEETGKTYFSVRMNVPLNGSKTITVRYRLPFKLNLDPVDKYSLIVQKQAGQENIALQKRIFPDSRVLNYKYFPETGNFDLDGVLSFEMPLLKDLSFSSVWGK
ncbi:DUF4012 domain-containing protein [Candidatus Peregrinibacteria bacterium]|nr:DUF4012 domain-containing protein [Candidatus Peregrinibacteria bacterium]